MLSVHQWMINNNNDKEENTQQEVLGSCRIHKHISSGDKNKQTTSEKNTTTARE